MKPKLNSWENEYIKMELKDDEWCMTVKVIGWCPDYQERITGSLNLFKRVKNTVENMDIKTPCV